MVAIRHSLIAAWALALGLGSVACTQSPEPAATPAKAASNQSNGGQSSGGSSYQESSNEYGDEQESREEDSDDDVQGGAKLVAKCEERGGTYVEDKGCFVCKDESQHYDAEQESCMTKPKKGEQAVKVANGVFTIIGGALGTIPKNGAAEGEDEDDEYYEDEEE